MFMKERLQTAVLADKERRLFDGTCNFGTNSLRSGAMFMKGRLQTSVLADKERRRYLMVPAILKQTASEVVQCS